jgi:hypothetical protein
MPSLTFKPIHMNRPSATPGVCRIDQPSHRTHGFFVRLQRKGKIHSAFFTDKMHGGRAQALAAAQEHCRKLAAKLGTPVRMSRRDWAEIRRRKGLSGIHGVQKIVDRRFKRPRIYWKASWSPEPYVVRRRQFSARKFGDREARRLAIRARRADVRSMKPARPKT